MTLDLVMILNTAFPHLNTFAFDHKKLASWLSHTVKDISYVLTLLVARIQLWPKVGL